MIRTLALIGVTAILALAVMSAIDLAYFKPRSLAQAEISETRQALLDFDSRLQDAHAELARLQAARQTYHGDLVLKLEPVAAEPWLLGRIRQSVAATGGMASATQTASTPLSGQHDKLSLLLRVGFEEQGLLNFIKQVESGSPPLLIESLSVQPTNVAQGQRSLDVTATISVIISNADPT